MNIIINNSSMIPIYQQVKDQIKALIIEGKLVENDTLPSVRSLSKDLKISALTVKKAYDALEEEGFTVTIHGKGTYIAAANQNFLMDERIKEIESDFEMAIQKGFSYGLNNRDIKNIFDLILGEEDVENKGSKKEL